jgi:hypothetical protein
LHNYKWYFKNPSQFIILYILLKEWLKKMNFPSNKLVYEMLNLMHQTCLSIEKILCIFSRRNEINMGSKLSWFPDFNAKINIWISGHRSQNWTSLIMEKRQLVWIWSLQSVFTIHCFKERYCVYIYDMYIKMNCTFYASFRL